MPICPAACKIMVGMTEVAVSKIGTSAAAAHDHRSLGKHAANLAEPDLDAPR
jgi:hypothetical protein